VRHLSFISEFTTDVRHIKGKSNVVADALSRIVYEDTQVATACIPIHALSDTPYDLLQLAQAQRDDSETQALRTTSTGLSLVDVPIPETSSTVLCDISQGQPRPVVPSTLRKTIFDLLHDLSHPGIRSSRRIVSARFVWPGLNKDIGNWARTCLSCQQAKIHRHCKTPLQEFPAPDERFAHVHVDIVGPLPPSQGASYLFTCIDRFTRWPEAIPMTDATAESCATAFLTQWVSRFGVPTTITSDRGRQFESALWKALNNLLGTTRQRTTAYHPQSNGVVERFHRHLKTSLKARCTDSNWSQHLAIVLLGIRSTPKEDLNCSSAELVYGCPLRLPGEFFATPDTGPADPASFLGRLRTSMRTLRAPQTSWHRRTPSSVPQALLTSPFVFVRQDAHRSPLERPYKGPFRVLNRDSKFFTLDLNGRTDTVSMDRLKPAFTDSDLMSIPFSDTIERLSPNFPPPQHTRAGRVIHPPDRFTS